MQWWFKKFCKGDESLEDEECSGRASGVNNDQLSTIIEVDPLITTTEVAEDVSHSIVIQLLKEIGKVKTSLSGCLIGWPKIKIKKCRFEVSSSLILWNNNFSIRLWCAMRSGLYVTTGDDQLRDWTKKKFQSTSQSQTCIRKWSWSLSGGLLLAWCTTAFWIPTKPLHQGIMLCKWKKYTENRNTCSWICREPTHKTLPMTRP